MCIPIEFNTQKTLKKLIINIYTCINIPIIEKKNYPDIFASN